MQYYFNAMIILIFVNKIMNLYEEKTVVYIYNFRGLVRLLANFLRFFADLVM